MENLISTENDFISNVIAIINYNQKNYYIYNDKNSINYAILDNKQFKFNIDIETIKILEKFYNLIRYNKEYSIFCGNYKLNHKKFEIYQDLRSKLYTFVLTKDNKRYIPCKEDTIMLNQYFNNEQFVFFDEKQGNEKKTRNNNSKPVKFIKKVLKIGGITVVALISATILTYNLPQTMKTNIDYEIGKTFRKDLTQKNKSYNFGDLEVAIDNNSNIPETDKSFIKSLLEDEFEENKKYMDISKLIKKLKTMDIQYDKYYTYNEQTGEYELTHGDDLQSDVSAYYNSVNNKMTCLEPHYFESEIEEKINEPFEFDEVDKSTYYHELNHMFTVYDLDSALSQLAEEMSFLEVNDYIRTNTGIFENISDNMQKNCNTAIFRETINEIFTQEYIEKYYQKTLDPTRGIGYFEELPYMYCLAEILPTDVLREYKFNDNDSIITDGLLNISDNKSETYKLMTSLKSLELYSHLISRAETNNNIDEYLKNNDFLVSPNETEEVKQEEAENYKRIHDGFAYFYKAKYNKEMSDDMNMLIYLYDTPVLTDEEKQKVVEYLNLSTENPNIRFEPKGYFSKNYMEAHPYITITYEDKDQNSKTININDNNRYIESNHDIER